MMMMVWFSKGAGVQGGDKYIYTRDDGPQRSWLDSGQQAGPLAGL